MWKSEQHRLNPNYNIFYSFVPKLKNHRTYEDYDAKPFKITCRHCTGYVRFSIKSGELLYITFIHEGMAIIRIYPEEIDPEYLSFQWTIKTTMHCIYQRLLKEVNGDHKYLRCLCIKDKHFNIMCTDIALDRVNLAWEEKFREKPTGNDAVFITDSK